MPTPPSVPSTRPVQSRPRRVQITLRDGDVVEGGIFLTTGQALAPYLGSRKSGWVNIVNATWRREGELHNHAVLQADHIVLASSPDRDTPVQFATPGSVARRVDLSFDDGSRIRGSLHLAERQRLSDYLAGCGNFLPLLDATRVPGGEVMGDIAVNSGCVKAVRDAKVFAPDAADPAAASEPWGGLRRGGPTPPLNRDVVHRPSGSIEVVTPGRVPDYRAAAATAARAAALTPAPLQAVPASVPAPVSTPSVAAAAIPAAPAEPESLPLTPAEQARTTALAAHWLMRLASDAQLQLPGVRELTAAPTLDELWSRIASANDMAEGELAIHVADAYQLEVANLDEATPEAMRQVPQKLARKLGILPLKVDGRYLTIAVSEPRSFEVEQQLGFVCKLTLRELVATPADIGGAIEWHYAMMPSKPAPKP